MRRTRSTILVLAVAFVGLVSCDSGGSADPTTIAPALSLPADASTPASSSTTSSTTEPATTVVDTTAPAGSLPEGDIGLSPDGPWRLVDSAPGITTPGLVYELMPKLWVYLPVEEDIEQGILWTLTEEDLPIIEAYLQARLVFFRVTQTNPFDLDDPGWAEWYTDAGESYRRVLGERSERGEVFDRDVGVVLRPTVIGDMRTDTQAVVFDCMLDGGVWRLPDGSLGEGSNVGVGASGVSSVVDLQAGRWRIEGLARQVEACR